MIKLLPIDQHHLANLSFVAYLTKLPDDPSQLTNDPLPTTPLVGQVMGIQPGDADETWFNALVNILTHEVEGSLFEITNVISQPGKYRIDFTFLSIGEFLAEGKGPTLVGNRTFTMFECELVDGVAQVIKFEQPSSDSTPLVAYISTQPVNPRFGSEYKAAMEYILARSSYLANSDNVKRLAEAVHPESTVEFAPMVNLLGLACPMLQVTTGFAIEYTDQVMTDYRIDILAEPSGVSEIHHHHVTNKAPVEVYALDGTVAHLLDVDNIKVAYRPQAVYGIFVEFAKPIPLYAGEGAATIATTFGIVKDDNGQRIVGKYIDVTANDATFEQLQGANDV